MTFSSRSIPALLLAILFVTGLGAQTSFQKIYDSSQGHTSDAILRLTDSIYLLAGGGGYQSPQMPNHPWLTKINSAGDVLWQQSYHTPINGFFTYVVPANDGGYLCIGYLTSNSSEENLIVKTDADGNWQWSKFFSGSSHCYGVQPAPDGYILTGALHAFTFGTVDGYLLKIDNAGELVWSKKYGVSGLPTAFSDLVVTADTVYVSGIFNSTRAFVAVDQESGDLYFAKQYPDSLHYGSELQQLRPTANGHFWASGLAAVPGSDQVVTTLQQLRPDGVMLSAQAFTTASGNLNLMGLLPTPDGGCLLSGYRPAGGTSWRSVLAKTNAAANVEAAFQYARISPAPYHPAQGTPEGGYLLPRKSPDGRLFLTKTGPDLLVEGCCTSPLSLQTTALPTAGNDFNLSAFAFGQAIQDITLSTVPRTFPSAPYCPPEPVLLAETHSFCAGDSVLVAGVWYTQPGAVSDTILSATACDTITTYTIQLLPQPTQTVVIEFCPGETVTIGGTIYDQPGTVVDTILVDGACDTIVTYTLQLLPQPTQTVLVKFCPGDIITIGGVDYDQPGTVVDTIPVSGVCDSIVIYTLQLLTQPTQTVLIEFCPGETVTIGGVDYNQPGTVVNTIPVNGSCDSIVMYTLQWLPQPTQTVLIEFCPGDVVIIGGVDYTQPDTVVVLLPAAVGCDTLATYVLSFSTLPQPSVLALQCPPNLTVNATAGASSAPATYAAPVATSDCPCPGAPPELIQGLSSGSDFPLGTTQVCYRATDACGTSASCCFSVEVIGNAAEEPCDTKTTACVRFEVLGIFQNPAGQRSYRLRVTNTCTSPLAYVAFQMPDGVVAAAPANNTTFTAPSGRSYTVRNANAAPFHSIRFKTNGAGLASGQADIFEYTLPPQAAPLFIHAAARLDGQAWYETHLNLFHCPVQPIANRPEETAARSPWPESAESTLSVFPNPFDEQLSIAFNCAEPGLARLVLTDLTGRLIFAEMIDAAEGQQRFSWATGGLPQGAYWVGLKMDGQGWVYRKVMLVR